MGALPEFCELGAPAHTENFGLGYAHIFYALLPGMEVLSSFVQLFSNEIQIVFCEGITPRHRVILIPTYVIS